MMETEIVYVCSPNFWRYLFLSLRTLITSGTQFDCVRIYVVSEKNPNWNIEDEHIIVENVPDIAAIGEWGYYWGNNKIHLTNSQADRVIYLDTDTMVLNPINQIYEKTEEDLLARYGVEIFMGKYFSHKNWKKALKLLGANDYPYYSPGFMIFQNRSHKKIEKNWHEIIRKILTNNLPFPVSKHAEMFAFSLAAAVSGLTHRPMENFHHRYAMIGEKYSDAVVYHLGTPGFYRHYLPIEKKIGLKNRKDLSVPRPKLIELHALYKKIRYRLSSMIYGQREKRLKY